MIFGRVVHAKEEGGRHIIRIAFGWSPVATQTRRPIRKDSHASSILRLFTRGLSRLGSESEHRAAIVSPLGWLRSEVAASPWPK